MLKRTEPGTGERLRLTQGATRAQGPRAPSRPIRRPARAPLGASQPVVLASLLITASFGTIVT
jgi:hypothetical protein